MTSRPPSFEHLLRMSDDTGLFEHARLTVPRRAGGYCVDDVARGLVVLGRQPAPDAAVTGLTECYLRFVTGAQDADGRIRNRLGADRRWQDQPGLDDCWGRALWGLGTIAARHPDRGPARRALAAFDLGAAHRSPARRAMAFAALGAAEVLDADPAHAGAVDLLAAAAAAVGRPATAGWPWPEPRLAYANAALAETLLVAGRWLADDRLLADGLLLLDWLLDVETAAGGHLSPTPVGGWEPGEARPGFDQQPIEAAALADACARALQLTGDSRWLAGLDRAVGWFLGANDAGIPLYDPASGGGCDGLHRDRRNENQGAESTLALISTLQHADRMALAGR